MSYYLLSDETLTPPRKENTMQQNGMSKSVEALAQAFQAVITEAFEPVVDMMAETEQRLGSRIDSLEERIDTTDKNMSERLIAQHKDTVKEVQRITQRGY